MPITSIFHTKQLKRYVVQCLLILYQDGARALLDRIRLKLLSLKRLHMNKRPSVSYRVEEKFSPLAFNANADPDVSIIIPIYNKPYYTFSCLKSILEKSNDSSYEVIIVDDGSDEDTSDMLGMVKNITVLKNKRNMGVVGSYNRGAGKAKGNYLVFLNNDTLVTQGWLSGLRKTLQNVPDAGLVGAKLVYPDGRLQEAGGIVWKDGSSWNYGNLDDPGRPEYSYMREADYCTGACLMIERNLFSQIGGFDSLYSPAYYEDVDLAFKVRSYGKRVIFEPTVEVVHFEGITSGRDLTKGVKRYQVLNQDKFRNKWQKELVEHRNNGVQPDMEKDRYVKKRILVLDSRMVTPDRDSGSMRMYSILKIITNMGCKATFASEGLPFQLPYVKDLQKTGIEVLYAPYVASIESYLKKKGREFDAVILSRADLAEKYIEIAKKCCPDAVIIFDTVDVHFIREKRMAGVKQSKAMAWIAEERKRQELALVENADVTLVVSHTEKEILSSLSQGANIQILSNIHQVHNKPYIPFDERAGILFVGGFEHPPNIDAVCYYIDQILPIVREKLNGAKTYIIGSNPPDKIKKHATGDLIIPGHVKDIEPYFQACRVSIAPLRFGAGVKGKINLSMSYGVPVVATGVAIEGMHLKHGMGVMVGDTPQKFADELVNVYKDESLWVKLSKNGKENVKNHFSFEVAQATLKDILKL